MDLEEDLATALRVLAAMLLTEESLKADLEGVARLCVDVIPGCTGASVALLIEGEASTVAVSDRLSLEMDLLQYENAEGPCLVALEGRPVRVAFAARDERFPHFAVGAADRRVQSVLSVPLVDDEDVVGTLNLYGREPTAFDEHDEAMALVIAAEAPAAIVKSSLFSRAHDIRGYLQERHDARAQVAQAEGVLMAMQECSAEQAAGLLRHAADVNGERLVEAAQRVIANVRSTGASDSPS
jgi:GAF domain-containing protein